MHLRWKDLETTSNRWYGLAVEVTASAERSSRQPPCRLETGANQRIQLMQGITPLLWATLLDDYAGVHLLKSHADAPHAFPPDALSSAAIQRIQARPAPERLSVWSRHFAQALASSRNTFLHPGLWIFAGVRPENNGWQFPGEALSSKQSLTWPLTGVREALNDSPVDFVDWWFRSGRDVFSLRRSAPADDGRLKWWRKKAREDALPPVLLWHAGCLNAYLIADGHLRLQAALLEDRPPEFLVVSAAREVHWATDPVSQQRILESLNRKLTHSRGQAPSVDRMNAVLIAAFDDRPVLEPRTHAWARIPSDAYWAAQVEARLRASKRLDALPAFIQRTHLPQTQTAL